MNEVPIRNKAIFKEQTILLSYHTSIRASTCTYICLYTDTCVSVIKVHILTGLAAFIYSLYIQVFHGNRRKARREGAISAMDIARFRIYPFTITLAIKTATGRDLLCDSASLLTFGMSP
jgi:hypothetical protein